MSEDAEIYMKDTQETFYVRVVPQKWKVGDTVRLNHGGLIGDYQVTKVGEIRVDIEGCESYEALVVRWKGEAQ